MLRVGQRLAEAARSVRQPRCLFLLSAR